MDTQSASAFLDHYNLSPAQLDQLRDLLGKGIGIDGRVEQFRQAMDEAQAHHKALLQDPLSPADLRDNAGSLYRAARVDQAKASTQLNELFKVATERGLGKPFEDVRKLVDLAPRDSLAAKEMMAVYKTLDLPVPEEITSKYVASDRGSAELGDPEGENGIELDDPERALGQRTKAAAQAAEQDRQAPVDETELGNEVAGDTGLQGMDRRRNPRAMPEYILTTFHRKGDKYLDPKDLQSLIFLDKGDKLKTALNFDQRAIRAMMDVAQERGWHSVKLTGTPEFRRAAWFEAASRGLEVKGYKPTEAEIAAAAEAAKATGAENSVERQFEKRQQAEKDPKAAQKAATSETEHDAGQPATEQPTRPETLRTRGPQPTGRLIEHGRAPFEFNEDNKSSYYLKVATPRGEQTYWGVDFPRALEESGAQVGQEVTIKNLGKQAVTVEEPVRDADGKIIGQQMVDTHRNKWEVTPLENEQLQAFRQAQTPEQKAAAAKSIPNLKNAFAFEAALQKFAETRLQPGDVDQFMQLQRAMIQRDLADGVAFPDVQVREVAKSRKATRERIAEHGHEH